MLTWHPNYVVDRNTRRGGKTRHGVDWGTSNVTWMACVANSIDLACQ
jgi:hypothetical protein